MSSGQKYYSELTVQIGKILKDLIDNDPDNRKKMQIYADCGIHPATLHRILTGENFNISLRHIAQIAKVFGKDLWEVLRDIDTKNYDFDIDYEEWEAFRKKKNSSEKDDTSTETD